MFERLTFWPSQAVCQGGKSFLDGGQLEHALCQRHAAKLKKARSSRKSWANSFLPVGWSVETNATNGKSYNLRATRFHLLAPMSQAAVCQGNAKQRSFAKRFEEALLDSS